MGKNKDQTPKADPPPAEEPPAEEPDAGDSKNVVVSVKRAIGHMGVVIRPKIDGGRGKPPVIKCVKGVIPRALAESYGGDYVDILGPAPDDAKIGPVEEKK